AAKQKQFGNPWKDIDLAMQTYHKIFMSYIYLERHSGWGDMADYARDLVRLAAEQQKPNGERLREYRESAIASLQQSLLSTAPVYKSLNVVLLSEAFREMRDDMGAGNPTVQKI